MTSSESAAYPKPEQPDDQRTSIGVDSEGKFKKIVTTPDGTTRLEDFRDLNEVRDLLIAGQQFNETVYPPDFDFDPEAFARQHEAGGRPNLEILRENLRRLREGGQA